MQHLVSSFSTFGVDLLRLFVWLVLLLVIFVPLEQRWSLRRQKFFRRSFGTDLVYYFLSGFTPKLMLIVPLSLMTAASRHFDGGGLYPWMAGLSIWVRFPAAAFVADFGAYWGHRWSHELPLLWRFHSIHHSAEEIDWLVNTRAHPVDLFFTRLCGLVPMYLLGLAQPMADRLDPVPVLVTVVATIWGFFIHANVNWRFGPLEWIVSTPAFHHWHHTNDRPDRINRNYAALLPWLDKCFGTLYLPAREWPAKYGTDTVVSSNLAGQLVSPFVPGSHPPA